MQAAWVTALAEVASARFGGQGALLHLPGGVATLFAGYAVGQRVLVRETAPEPGGAAAGRDTRGTRAAPFMVLALGGLWSVAVVWLGRHSGEGPGWLAEVRVAVQGVWGPALADVLALGVTFALWWHGQRTGQALPEHDSTVRAFGIGGLVFAGALLWAAGLPSAPAGLPLTILLYLGAGLPALSLARLQEVRRDLEANVVRGEPARLDAAWWRTLAPPVVAVVLIALLAALVLSDAAWRGAILTGMGAAREGLLALLYVPVLLIGYVAEWLIYILRSLRRPPGEQEAPPSAPGGGDLLQQLPRADGPLASLEGLRWGVLAVAGLAALLAFLASSGAVRRVREGSTARTLDREGLSTWRLFLSDLGALWRTLLRRLRMRGEALAALPRAVGGGAVEDVGARDAREAYRRLLTLGRQHAVPRRAHQTPHEYLALWRAGLPAEAEASELTGTYARARYGPPLRVGVPASRLRALLARIQDALVTPRPRA